DSQYGQLALCTGAFVLGIQLKREIVVVNCLDVLAELCVGRTSGREEGWPGRLLGCPCIVFDRAGDFAAALELLTRSEEIKRLSPLGIDDLASISEATGHAGGDGMKRGKGNGRRTGAGARDMWCGTKARALGHGSVVYLVDEFAITEGEFADAG